MVEIIESNYLFHNFKFHHKRLFKELCQIKYLNTPLYDMYHEKKGGGNIVSGCASVLIKILQLVCAPCGLANSCLLFTYVKYHKTNSYL